MEEENISEQVQSELDENTQSSLAETKEIPTDSVKNDDETKISDMQTSDISVENQNTDDGKAQEQRILKEVLEKLNIKEQRDSQENFFKDVLAQESVKNNTEIKAKNAKLRQIVSSDLTKIEKFVQQGVINPSQGQNLKNLVLKKAFDKYVQYGTIPKNKNNFPAFNQNFQQQMPGALSEFHNEKPEFFNKEGRNEVINYLKSGGVNVGKDDLNRISAIVESVEKNAIDRYLKKSAYEKNLQKANDSAKQKLRANAQSASFSDGGARTFTRKQIGKMSSEEFTKNESQIMNQLRKGLIR